MPEATKRTCNRHTDCDLADAKAKAARQAAIDKAAADPKWPTYLPFWRAADNMHEWADHCHDDCCEDCFGK